jgi:hypothetical protein
MRRVLLLLVIAACERSRPVESTPGGSSSSVVAPVIERGAATAGATIGTDAKPAVRRPPDPAITEEDASDMAHRLIGDDSYSDPGDMSNRRPGADLGRMIDDVRNSGTSVVSGGGVRGTQTGSGSAGTQVDATPPGRVTITDKRAFDQSTLTPDAVAAKLQAAYFAGIKRCYRNYLRTDPSARGKVRLSFTVNETGHTVKPKASGFAAEIDNCLTNMMGSWRFPVPRDKDGEVTDAAFDVALQMVPD